MNKLQITVLLSAALAVLSSTSVVAQTADTVYTNGKIYTVNEAQPWAEAVAIKDGKFIGVGNNDEIAAMAGDTTNVIDMNGSFAMPGLHDAHVHPPLVYTFQEAGELLFPESTSPDEIIEIVKAFAADNPDLEVVRGQKWAAAAFPGGKATKEWLDPHFPDRGIYLVDETGHNAVANSVALKVAGITKDTPDPDNGAIDRDPATGQPTGYLSETAMGLVAKYIKRPDVDANYRGMIRSLGQIRAYGITSLVDMAAGPNSIAAYQKLESEGKLNMRIHAAIALNDYAAEQTTEEESEDLIARIDELDSPLLDFAIKYWADGTPLSKTALMVEPYADDPSTKGIMTIGNRQFERIKQAHRDGITVRLHATTDGTTRKLLDVIEEARAEDPKPELRHHIGHLLTVTKEDIPRFRELNVIAEFSPVWWYPTQIGKIASKYIGALRYARWMAIKEFLDAGVTVSVGSDWPAGTPDADPWKGIEGMITRMDPHTSDGEKLGEPVDLETAIKIYTMNGARAMMHEDMAGSIEVGKHADMVLLDKNLFEIDPTEISDVKVIATVFAGEQVYKAAK